MRFSRYVILARRCRPWAAGLCAVWLSVPVFAAEPPALQMGVVPYLSNDRLFEYFLPMRNYLEAQFGRRTVLSTAPDFKTYVQRAARGDYDVYLTAPHFALLAEVEHGHRRMSRLTREHDTQLIVLRRDSEIHRPEDLRGRTVVTPDALSVSAMLGEYLLGDLGLRPGKGYQLLRASSHNNAIMTVYRGGADAAFTFSVPFEQLPSEVKRELKFLASPRRVPHIMIMAHPRLPEADYRRLRSMLLGFTRNGPGREFFEATGYTDMAPIVDADMAPLRPFLSDLRDRLQ